MSLLRESPWQRRVIYCGKPWIHSRLITTKFVHPKSLNLRGSRQLLYNTKLFESFTSEFMIWKVKASSCWLNKLNWLSALLTFSTLHSIFFVRSKMPLSIMLRSGVMAKPYSFTVASCALASFLELSSTTWSNSSCCIWEPYPKMLARRIANFYSKRLFKAAGLTRMQTSKRNRIVSQWWNALASSKSLINACSKFQTSTDHKTIGH